MAWGPIAGPECRHLVKIIFFLYITLQFFIGWYFMLTISNKKNKIIIDIVKGGSACLQNLFFVHKIQFLNYLFKIKLVNKTISRNRTLLQKYQLLLPFNLLANSLNGGGGAFPVFLFCLCLSVSVSVKTEPVFSSTRLYFLELKT